MSTPEAALKQKIRESGRDIKNLAKDAHVSPIKLWRWVTGRTVTIGLNDADKVKRLLTGEGVGL